MPDNGGAHLVPAFSGLFAPYWRPAARGVIVGLTRFVTDARLAREAFEAVAFQILDVVDVMNFEARTSLPSFKVDGGIVANALLMQFQTDLLGVPVVRLRIIETTVLGVAFAAGLAVGFLSSISELPRYWAEDRRWIPRVSCATRDRLIALWYKSAARTLN